jgi:hypothetical protein
MRMLHTTVTVYESSVQALLQLARDNGRCADPQYEVITRKVRLCMQLIYIPYS